MVPPLPGSIIFLTCLSLCLALCILTCSSLDLGMLSLWVNPACALVTISYHVALLSLTYLRPEKAAMFYISSIAWAYILSVAWLGAFAVMALIACGGYTDLYLCGLVIHVPVHPITTQKFQFMLTPLECVIMGDLAIRITVLRRGVHKTTDVI